MPVLMLGGHGACCLWSLNSRFSKLMNRTALSLPIEHRVGNPQPLPSLRESDGSGLALCSALFMAGSVVLAFFSSEPAHARPDLMARAPSVVSGSFDAGANRQAWEPAAPEAEPAAAASWH